MSGIFSQHVENVSAGETIDPAIRNEIRQVLRSELRRRGILEYGPSLLGYLGHSWGDQEAMDDLIHDCYIRAIATRLPGLRRNLKKSGDIERLVRRNIRTFVGEQQKALDPVGYAVYQNCKAVVVGLTGLGVLVRAEAENTSVTAESLFAFASASEAGEAENATFKESLRTTGKLFDGIEKLPHVGTAAQEILANALQTSAANVLGRFSLGALKRCVCELLDEASVASETARELPFSSLQSEFAENLRTVSPDTGYEQTESIAQLAETIRKDITALSRSEVIKSRLCRLLDYLADVATQGDGQCKETLDQLAERFQVSRSTMHEDFQSLRSVVRRHAGAIVKNLNGDRHG